MKPIETTGKLPAGTADRQPAEASGRLRVIGITGGVGAGKSTVLDYLASLPGVRVEEADRIGHLVMEPGTKAFREIREHFGEEILDVEGRIARPVLSRLVFADREELSWLNGVIHPAVKDWFRQEIRREKEKGALRLFVIEAALLIEDHYEELCEEFWYIYTEPEIRRERLRASRGYTDEKIEAIFRNQQTDEGFRAHCREAIDNSGSPRETLAQVRALLVKKGLWSERYEGKGDT